MDAEILAVGTELLLGQIANTNAQFISELLPEAGINVYRHSVVGDNPKRLAESIQTALSRSDIVITTGGLGPTEDDLTKEVAASVMKRCLVPDEQTLNEINAYFRKVQRPMAKSNLKQALIPEGCIIIRNSNGTAPGCIIEDMGKTLILLPGPPREMRPMFKETVLPYLSSKSAKKLVSKYIRIFGIGESAVEDRLLDIIDAQTNPTIAPYAKGGEVTIRVTAECGMDEKPERLLEPTIQAISQRLGDNVYSTENQEMHEVAAKLLMEKQLTVSTAESCSGGLIAQKLTSVPGISASFIGGVVAYSDKMKIDMLGVEPGVLYEHGAVSARTAEQMAEGIRIRTGSDIGISVTGIAGPGGATDKKPIGLVYIGFSDKEATFSKELRLWGDRERIRGTAALHSLDLLRRYLLGRQTL